MLLLLGKNSKIRSYCGVPTGAHPGNYGITYYVLGKTFYSMAALNCLVMDYLLLWPCHLFYVNDSHSIFDCCSFQLFQYQL